VIAFDWLSVRRSRCAGGRASLALALVLGLLAVVPIRPAGAVSAGWEQVRQFGTPARDFGTAVSRDGVGNVLVTGQTEGDITGVTEFGAGSRDAFVVKYDAGGTRLWTRQLGTAAFDSGNAVGADGAGNVYVAGSTSGTLPDAQTFNAGGFDAFLAKYAADGTRLWVRLLGTAADEAPHAVAVDADGNAYLAGQTGGTLPGSTDTNAGSGDSFVAKYDSTGAVVWVRQFGSAASDGAAGLVRDETGALLVVGSTEGTMPGTTDSAAGGSDAFLMKLGASGAVTWVRQLGSAATDNGYALAVDGTGDIVMTGRAGGALPGGGVGAIGMFVARFDGAGAVEWVRQTASTVADDGRAVAIDAAGLAYVAGSWVGNYPLNDPFVPSSRNLFVAVYSVAGTRLWIDRLGTDGEDDAYGLVLGGGGVGYVAGSASGLLPGAPGSYLGNEDVYLAQYRFPTVPAAPTVTTVTPTTGGFGAAAAQVAFSAGADGGTPVTAYRATCVPIGGGITRTADGVESPVIVSDLTIGGSYSCSVAATNAFGAGPASDPAPPYTAIGPPGTPTIASVTPGNARVTVAITPPTGNGGSPITGYEVTCTVTAGTGAVGVAGGTTSSVVVTGLTNGKTYRCRATAANAYGASFAGVPSAAFIPATVPGAPTGVVTRSGATALATGPLVVSFSPPLSNGGRPITAYSVSCTSANGGVARTATGASAPVTVTGATTGKSYTCRVRAANAMGTGPFSVASGAVIVGSPPAPTLTGVTKPVAGSLRVTFTPNGGNGSPITGFVGGCTSSNGGVQRSVSVANPAALAVVVTGLTVGKTYTCRVRAVNARGTGLASLSSSAKVA